MRERTSGLRERLTFSNVIAMTALFAALGGSAWALATNSVRSKHIVNGQVKSRDIGNGQVKSADIGNGQVKSADIGNRAVSAGQVAGDSWHELGDPGEPVFQSIGDCTWVNYGSGNEPAGFFRDIEGIVHLKGLIKVTDTFGPRSSAPATLRGSDPGPEPCSFAAGVSDRLIFSLPAGYAPEHQTHLVAISKNALARIRINAAGGVFSDLPNTAADAKDYLSLDGLSFPAAP